MWLPLTIVSYGTLLLIILTSMYAEHYKLNMYTKDNIYYGRNIPQNVINYLDNYKTSLEYARKLEYDNLFVLSSNAYFLKLSEEQQLTKFDLINNGNMGYLGASGYIKEIEEICRKKECVFILEKYNLEEDIGQVNKEILSYPQKKYQLKSTIGQFEIYKNDKRYVK